MMDRLIKGEAATSYGCGCGGCDGDGGFYCCSCCSSSSSVEEDLEEARKAVMEAVEILKKVDERDAEDLLCCVGVCGIWG